MTGATGQSQARRADRSASSGGRRPWEDRGTAMILSLSLMTVAIAVQGWFGGALVHGVDHLNW
jgi:hypothetical protein